MTSETIVARLRALIRELEADTETPAPTKSVAEARYKAAAPAGAKTVEIEVGYWGVKDTKNGKPMASLSPKTDSEERVFWRVFDEKLILKVDPLRKGERVRATIRPWNDTFVVDALERVGASAPAGSAGIGEDEIPF